MNFKNLLFKFNYFIYFFDLNDRIHHYLFWFTLSRTKGLSKIYPFPK